MFLYNKVKCVCVYLNWFNAACESHACGLMGEEYRWRACKVYRVQFRKIREPLPQNTHTHANPVSYASLPTPGCISACNAVAIPDVSLTGRRKLLFQPLFLGRCVICSLSSKHTMRHLSIWAGANGCCEETTTTLEPWSAALMLKRFWPKPFPLSIEAVLMFNIISCGDTDLHLTLNGGKPWQGTRSIGW